MVNPAKAKGGFAAAIVNKDHIARLARKNRESGWMDKIRTKESASLGGKVMNHNRWHVQRNKSNPKCELCRTEQCTQINKPNGENCSDSPLSN